MVDKKTQSASNKATNAFENPFYDAMKGFQMPQWDQEATVKAYRKNIEAMTTAQKSLLEMMKEVTTMNADFSRNMMEDMKDHMQALGKAKTMEEKTQLNVDKVKSNLENIMLHSKEITDLWSKSCTSVGEKIQKRFQESVEEAQHSMKGKATKH